MSTPKLYPIQSYAPRDDTVDFVSTGPDACNQSPLTHDANYWKLTYIKFK